MRHLTEHTQFLNNEPRTFLSSHEDILNDLLSKCQSVSISTRVLDYPFIELEKWRIDAHRKLDQLAERKRHEIQKKISEYRNIFTEKINEQKQKLELLKNQLADLSQKTYVTNKEIKYLENKVNETKLFLQSIEKHSIKISTYAFFVNIRPNFFDSHDSKTLALTTSKIIQSTKPTRNTSTILKECIKTKNKQYLDKKRSLSICLL